MTSMQDADVQALDGRLARSQRTRRAIVEALRSLHQDGDLRPTAPRVAQRAGVSLRTVFQHFDDLEALFVEAGRRDAEIALGHLRPIDGALPVPERLRLLLEQRSAMFEQMAPTWRAARLMEPFSAQIQTNRDRLMDYGRRQLEQLFAPELRLLRGRRRADVLNALQAATSWALWESLRSELRLDEAAARQAVTALVSNLLPTS